MGRTRKTKTAVQEGVEPTPPALPSDIAALFERAVCESVGNPTPMSAGSALARLIGRVFEVALEEELNEHLGYQPHERLVAEPTDTAEEPAATRRANTRNGYTGKRLKTAVGSTSIQVPRDRDASFEPRLLPKHRSAAQHVEERVVAMYASGMSTSDISEHLSALYGFEASEMFVSRLIERLDPELNAWRNRPLEELYAIVYVDALHLKVRHPSGVASTAAYIASGYGEAGHLEVLGVWIAPSEFSEGHGESARFWQTVFAELQKRGLKQLLIVSSDALSGMVEALAAVYPEAGHIPCVVHLMRASLSYVGSNDQKIVAADLKTIYQAPSYEAAEAALEACRQKYRTRYPAMLALWQRRLPELAALWNYTPVLRRLVYTSNPQENINRQVRKVTKNRGVMPNPDSAKRLLTLVLRQVDERSRRRPTRPDWVRIVEELHVLFAASLPPEWGRRLRGCQ